MQEGQLQRQAFSNREVTSVCQVLGQALGIQRGPRQRWSLLSKRVERFCWTFPTWWALLEDVKALYQIKDVLIIPRTTGQVPLHSLKVPEENSLRFTSILTISLSLSF